MPNTNETVKKFADRAAAATNPQARSAIAREMSKDIADGKLGDMADARAAVAATKGSRSTAADYDAALEAEKDPARRAALREEFTAEAKAGRLK